MPEKVKKRTVMQTITKLIAILILMIGMGSANAQDSINVEQLRKIEVLEKQKEKIKAEERDQLKLEVEAINKRLENGEITADEAERLKNLAAEKHAANIENRVAIVDNKIALLRRNTAGEVGKGEDDYDGITIRIGKDNEDDNRVNGEF